MKESIQSASSSDQGNMLIVTFGVPHISKGASAVVFYLYIKALRERFDSITHLVVFSDEKPDDSTDLNDYLQGLPTDESFKVISTRLSSPVQFSLPPFSWKSITWDEEILSKLDKYSFKKIVCFDIFAAAITVRLPCKHKVIWLGDLRYQTEVYHGLYNFILDPRKILTIPKALFSSLAWRRFYRETLSSKDIVIASSKSAEVSLRKIGIRSTYLAYPWVDGAPGNSVRKPKREIPSFILFGNLAALGSKSALLFLCRRVYPRLIRYWGAGGFRVLIAGIADIPAWALSEVKNRPEFEFLGFVPDLAAEIDSCHAVIVPISAPVGNRSRIITAMSMRSLVIAHRNTALGNPALVSGENCFLARSPREFVHYMIRSFENQSEALIIAEAARSAYRKSFHPDSASQNLVKILEN